MELLLVAITALSLTTNLWIAHALRNNQLPVTVVFGNQAELPESELSIATPDPEPATDAVTESVKNDPRTVQAWVNQRGIPMAAYPSSHDAPNIPKQAGPQERPYGFVSGAIPS